MELTLTSIILYGAGITLVLLVGIVANAINQLMGIRIQRPRLQPDNGQQAPEHLEEIYQSAAQQLTVLGFEPHHCQLSRDIIAHEYAEKIVRVMIHRQSRVFAEISPASTVLDLPGYEIDFWSISRDGKALITVNGRGHSILGDIPGVTIHDPLETSLAEQYHSHLEQRNDIFTDNPAVTVSTAVYLKLQQKLLDGYFLGLIKDGSIQSTGNNEFRLSFAKAISILPRFIKGDLKVQRLLRKKLAHRETQNDSRKTAESSAGSPINTVMSTERNFSIDSEVQSYLRLSSARERNPAGIASKLIMFAITLVLSYFAFGLVFSFGSVLILLGVILFHELGHIAAMYAFKYRDLQILFIPLLGAAATGKKDKVEVWKQVVVYLMGPLPGILVGILLIAWYQQVQWAWLYETAIIMLVINYLNLLPFVPLDGGHIVRLTIMERFPTGKLLFTGLSIVAFAAGGWFLGEPIFWVLAAIMLVSLPWSALEAGVLNELYQQPLLLDDLDKKGKLKLLFETLKQPRFHKLQFSQKYDLAKSLSEVLLQPQHLGRLGTLGLAGAYIGALLLTPPAIMVTTVGFNNAYNIVALMSGNHPIKDWDTEIAQADTAVDRFDIMLDASKFFIATSDLPEALRYLEQAETTFSVINNDSALSRLYQAYSQFYRHKQDLTQAESYILKIIKLHLQTPQQYTYELANDYQTLATIYIQQNKVQGLHSVLNDGLAYALKVQNPEQRYLITTLTGQLMDLYYRQGQFDQAEKLLRDILPELRKYRDPLNSQITNYVYQEIGWLFVAKKDPDTAMEYFNKALTLSTGSKKPLNTLAAIEDITDNNSTASITTIDLLLAMTAVQYEKGNMSIAQDYLQKAAGLIKDNYFESLDQYINTYATDYRLENDDASLPRDTARWQLISEAHQYFTPKKTAAIAEKL